MGKLIMVLGESGTGKSTSLRNLDPKETYIINVLGKPLPFRGATKKYFTTNEKEQGNIFSSDNYEKIKSVINHINDHRPEITNLVIDDFCYLMTTEFMDKVLIKGFDKFSEMAKNVFTLMQKLKSTRDSLFCFVLTHAETDNNGKSRPKTLGKLIGEKVGLEEMVTVALHTIVHESQYKFLTNHTGSYLAKTPMDMFDKQLIDNDLQAVKIAFQNYINAEL